MLPVWCYRVLEDSAVIINRTASGTQLESDLRQYANRSRLTYCCKIAAEVFVTLSTRYLETSRLPGRCGAAADSGIPLDRPQTAAGLCFWHVEPSALISEYRGSTFRFRCRIASLHLIASNCSESEAFDRSKWYHFNSLVDQRSTLQDQSAEPERHTYRPHPHPHALGL